MHKSKRKVSNNNGKTLKLLIDSSRQNPMIAERMMIDAVETLYSIEDG
jgi:hypothetical protein